MRFRTTLLLLLLAGLAVWAGPERASAEVSADQLRNDVYWLASDTLKGRKVGTEGERLAADYIQSRFQSLGVTPAFGESYRQPFEVVTGLSLGGNNSLRMTTGGESFSAKVERDYLPMSYSATDASASGPVVFAGYGISAPDLNYDDLAEVDVAGKVALIFRYEPYRLSLQQGLEKETYTRYSSLTHKLINLREAGAEAVIMVHPPAGEYAPEKDRLPRLGSRSVGQSMGIPVVFAKRTVANRWLQPFGTSLSELQDPLRTLATNSQELSGITAEMTVDLDQETGTGHNVAGLIQSGAESAMGEYVVVGAHYDHLGMGGASSLAPEEDAVHNGADDNASGTAAVLALAEYLKQRQGELRRSVLLVLFSGEEGGLLGSDHFVKNPPVPLEKVAAMFNLDMVGRPRKEGWIVGGVGTSPAFSGILEQVKSTGAPEFQAKKSGRGSSDQLSFVTKQIPVMWAFDGGHGDYHKPSDDAAKLDYPALAEFTRFWGELVHLTAALPHPIEFSEVARDEADQPDRGGFKVQLGTLPDYQYSGEGVRINGTTPDTPAEEVGLQSGDILLQLGPVELADLYDLVYALRNLEAGKDYELVYRRDGEENRTTVTLIPRAGER